MTCERIIERLVDSAGVRPTEDPQVAAHLGSCLRCYRAAADLRDVAPMTELLKAAREESLQLASPGEAFWRSFPGQVASSWAGQRQATADTADSAAPSWFAQVHAFLRRPMPAAFAGAACAAAVAFVVVTPLRDPVRVQPSVSELTASNGSSDPTAGDESISRTGSEELPFAFGGAPTLDESVSDMDQASLGLVLEKLGHQLGSGGDESELPASDLAGGSDELDDLDEQALEALREQLGRSI